MHKLAVNLKNRKMKNRKISIDTKSNTKLISVGLIWITVNIILFASGKSISNYNIQLSSISTSESIYFLVELILRISCTVWCIIEAAKLNRSILFWGILTFAIPPISMILLGFKDLSLNDELKKVYNKYQSEFFIESLKLKKNFEKGKITELVLKERVSSLKEKYEESMNSEMKVIENMIEERHKTDLVEKFEGGGKIIKITDKCPACGTQIKDTDLVCSDCGLGLN